MNRDDSMLPVSLDLRGAMYPQCQPFNRPRGLVGYFEDRSVAHNAPTTKMVAVRARIIEE